MDSIQVWEGDGVKPIEALPNALFYQRDNRSLLHAVQAVRSSHRHYGLRGAIMFLSGDFESSAEIQHKARQWLRKNPR